MTDCSRFLIIMICYAISGCANRVTIDSIPQGATVTVGQEVLGTTPLTVELQSADIFGQGTRMTLDLPGFYPVTGPLDWTIDNRHWATTWLMIGANLHPRVHRRLLDSYTVVLDEYLDKQPVPRQQRFYGRDQPVPETSP